MSLQSARGLHLGQLSWGVISRLRIALMENLHKEGFHIPKLL